MRSSHDNSEVETRKTLSLDAFQWCLVGVLVTTSAAAASVPAVATTLAGARYIFALGLAYFAWQSVAHLKKLPMRLDVGFLPWLQICCLVAFTSAIFAWSPTSSLIYAAAMTLLGIFVSGLMWRRWADGVNLDDAAVLSGTMGAIFTIGIIADLAGFSFTRTSGDLTSAQALALSEQANRFRGIFNNPNQASIVAAVAAPLSVAAWSRKRGMAHLVWAMAALVTIGLSESRTALIAVAITGLLLGLRGMGRATQSKTFGAMLVASVISILAAFTIGGNIFGQGLARLTRGDGGSLLNGREDIWREALTLWGDEKAFGYGVGSTGALPADMKSQGVIDTPIGSVHNSYIQWLLETGFVGLIPMAALVIALIFDILRQPHSLVHLCLQWSVAAGLLVQLTESAIFGIGSPYTWIFWFAASAMTVLRIRSRHHAVETDKQPRLRRPHGARTGAPSRLPSPGVVSSGPSAAQPYTRSTPPTGDA